MQNIRFIRANEDDLIYYKTKQKSKRRKGNYDRSKIPEELCKEILLSV